MLGVLLLLPAGCGPGPARFTATGGVLDLTGWDFGRDGVARLDGQWEVYPGRLLEPADLPPGRAGPGAGYRAVPGLWQGDRAEGTATYRLRVRLGPGRGPLALRLPEIPSAYRAWVNGRPAAGSGAVGEGPGDEVPRHSVDIVRIHDPPPTLSLVLQVSNHHFRAGGIADSVWLGRARDVERLQVLRRGGALLLAGGLLVAGLYHLLLFAFRRKDPSPLWLGLYCLLWGVNDLVSSTADYFVYQVAPGVPWTAWYAADMLTFVLSVPLMLMFIQTLFPDEGSPRVLRAVQVLALGFSALILLTPVGVFSRAVSLFYLVALLAIPYAYGVLARAVRRGRPGAALILAGGVLVGLTGVNDMLYDHRIVRTAFLMPLGVFVFVLFQSAALARRFAGAFGKVESLSEELEGKNLALSRMDRLKDEFLARTSHEIRTPLAGIVGLSESLLAGSAGPLPERAASSLGMIVSSGRRLAGLVNDILDASRLKHRDIELRTGPVDVAAVADAVLTVARPLAGDKPVELVNAVPRGLPRARADEGRLEQILLNLVGNAVKFTEEGEVRVSGEARDGLVEISVSDTGVGIPRDRLVAIFEPFEQASPGDARAFGGTGLGLAITRHLVDLHGGRLRVESEPGRGSVFRFTLPVSGDRPGAGAVPPDPGGLRGPAPPAEHPVPGAPLGEGVEVLVVDDDPVNLRVAADHLALHGAAVRTAASGPEALAAIGAGLRPDLVLLDVMMPGLSGYEVCRRLRQRFSLSELPVIMLTARARAPDVVEGLSTGANDYLVKPFSGAELVARVRLHLRIGQAYRTLRENARLRQEIERRRATEQELRVVQRRLSAVLDRVDDAVVAVNESAEITFCNRALETLLGREASGLLGRPLAGILSGGPDLLGRPGEGPGGTRVLPGIALVRGDGTEVRADALRAGLDLEDEHLDLLIFRAPDAGRGERPVHALAVIRELNRNRSRLHDLEEALNGLLPRVIREQPGFRKDIEIIDAALEEVCRSLARHRDPEARRLLAVEVMQAATAYWTEVTGTPRADLARRSGLWKVYTNLDGWERTQTLDRYLDVRTVPRRPRWRQVIRTGEFVLAACEAPSPLRDRLAVSLARLQAAG